VLVERDPCRHPGQQPRQPILAPAERQRPIDPVKLQQVEGLEDGIGDTAPPVEGVEHGDTIGAADHRLPVQRERPRLQFGRSVGDRRVAVGPVIAAAGDRTVAPSGRTISR
jgi:hypothetical protein